MHQQCKCCYLFNIIALTGFLYTKLCNFMQHVIEVVVTISEKNVMLTFRVKLYR